MAAYRVFAELTGQSLNTVRFCQPVIASDFPMVRHQPALVNPNSVALVSRLYDYRLMQLRDLSPGGPNVAAYPYHRLPPPHLLLGYQYMHRALNDYFFENRVFMQLGYESPPAQRPRRLFWTCLTDCSYSVNVGAYMRFLDLDNFHDSFQQMHNAVLMDRIASDMAHVHLRGRGVDVARSGDVVGGGDDLAAAVGEDDGDGAAAAAVAAARSHLSGSGAAGLQNDILLRAASRDDAVLLEAIRRLRVALCHYLFCYARERFNTENTYRFLPGSDVFGEENWLTLFTDAFAELDTQSLLRQAALDPRDHDAEEPAETMARCFVSTLATGQDYDAESRGRGGFSGGAIVLRNRRVTDRRGLRPRDRTGRAITASQVRRVRRRAVREFIDRLPRVIRRRRVPRPEPVEEEEPMVGEEEEEPVPPPPAAEEEEEETLLDEVIRTVLEAIDALQEELTGAARRHELFRFTNDFYRLLLQTRDADIALVTESFLRKWVLYFFLAEHVASTLYYLYTHFISNREFRRYVDVTTLQVLLVGWDVNAEPVFKRIWSEQSNPATIFETLWSRILRDFLMMVERTGQFEGMDEADQQLFLSDIQYRDRSGDIEEVLKQLNLSEEFIDSIDISFRIKFRGIVAINTNDDITANLRRVLRDREQDIAVARHAAAAAAGPALAAPPQRLRR
ncbi:terminal protein precursor pTP [Fowl aviadenovirus E]|uniref:Terminal protein pTP n=1 Tax=Fowl aviadenovirus E TaxID=190065 RepID=A0A5B8KHU2_9ADEN|nr:terminal protein precursor pTP [Fowl aviadenovirus E]USW46634.1 terminal protein precursor pTP [Fowl aviadenovirus E]